MLARIYSAAVYGVDAYEVEIEVNAGGGNPKIIIVGLPDTAVKESQDRVTTAINNSGYYWPRGRTTINLAPADVKKEGPSFDLPIALGMIATAQEIEEDLFADFSFVGELALNGAVRAVKGVLPVALEAPPTLEPELEGEHMLINIGPRWLPGSRSMACGICGRLLSSLGVRLSCNQWRAI